MDAWKDNTHKKDRNCKSFSSGLSKQPKDRGIFYIVLQGDLQRWSTRWLNKIWKTYCIAFLNDRSVSYGIGERYAQFDYVWTAIFHCQQNRHGVLFPRITSSNESHSSRLILLIDCIECANAMISVEESSMHTSSILAWNFILRASMMWDGLTTMGWWAGY